MGEACDFCGCCGNPCGRDRLTCFKCAKHMAPVTRSSHVEDRTWFGQYGTPCPFQVGVGVEGKTDG